jgi:hypothetical protein
MWIIMLACSDLANRLGPPPPKSQLDNLGRPITITELLPDLVTGIHSTSLRQKNGMPVTETLNKF